MSLHESIIIDLNELVTESDADIISASALAHVLYERYSPGPLDPRIAYTSIEGLKQMARGVLRGRFGTKDESDPDQGEFWAGRLQDRYPAAHKVGDERGYKVLDALIEDDVLWNVKQMDRSINGLTLHRNALLAWWQAKQSDAA